jgi:hypothetical protein
MVSDGLRERAALDAIARLYAKNGYQVIQEPSPEQLPAFLRGFRPDAIAIGRTPALVIQVLRAHSAAADTRVRQLQSLFADQPDWRLEVVYASSEGEPIEPATSDDIRDALGEARRLADAEPRAGLLLAWATLEAIGRKLEPRLAARGLSPRSLVDVLVSTGHMPQVEGGMLRRLGDARNAVAHGQLNLAPEAADVRRLVELGERLVA